MQLCEEAAKGGVTVVHNETGKINTYAFKGADWVSYDSSTVLKAKVDIYIMCPRKHILYQNAYFLDGVSRET